MAALDELWAVSDSSGDQVSLLDTLQDPGAPDPAAVMDQTDLKDRIADAIARLPEREKLVDRALLLREPDAPRDRRGPRRDRVARLPAAHQGRPAPAVAAAARRTDDRRAPLSARPSWAVKGRRSHPEERSTGMHLGADRIRNVALVGHRGSGKTSLHEALLFQAGAIDAARAR